MIYIYKYVYLYINILMKMWNKYGIPKWLGQSITIKKKNGNTYKIKTQKHNYIHKHKGFY